MTTIDEIRCPECGEFMGFMDGFDEEYMSDGRFKREENLYCSRCDIIAHAVQYYEPSDLDVAYEPPLED